MYTFDFLWGMMPVDARTNGAKYRNQLEFRNNFMQLFNLALSAFEWEGLPDTCNERYLELGLMMTGVGMIANDPTYNFVTLRGMPAGAKYNIYGEPSRINGYGFNGYTREYSCYQQGTADYDVEAVICRDNVMMYPYISYINMFAQRITDLMRTIDVATNKLKIPYFIQADQSQVASIKQILQDRNNNEESIIGSKAANAVEFNIMPTQVRGEVLKALWESLSNVDTRARETLGIESNPNKAKKERQITDEVGANDMFTILNIDHRLRQREIFCQTVNEVHGLNISVKLSEHMRELSEVDETKGGSEDGSSDPSGTGDTV